MGMEGLEQSTPPAKVEIKSLKSLKVGMEPDDCNPVCPAQGPALQRCLLMSCLLRERRGEEGGLCSHPDVQPGFVPHSGSL